LLGCRALPHGGGGPVSAAVLDLSRRGACLLLGRRLEPGAALSLEFARGGAPLVVPARVVYRLPQPRAHWLVGLSFPAALPEAAVRALLR
jgi:hypothetical protein